jgi:DNA-binding PadR family transcriptional regulator
MGSFHTMTSHGRLGSVTSRPAGRSTSAGAVEVLLALTRSLSQGAFAHVAGPPTTQGLDFLPLGLLYQTSIYRNSILFSNGSTEMAGKRRMEDGRVPLPLSPAVFHILLALAAGEMHGYAIMHEVAILSDGQVSIGPGTLYGSIKKMLADGLIQESHRRPDPELDDERRRYYRITEEGRRFLGAEAERLSRLVRVARNRRLLGGAPPVVGGAS